MILNVFKKYLYLHIPRRKYNNYLLKMDKAYLRHLKDTDQFQITFQYKNLEQKVDRQFNFARQLTETVSNFLNRVSTNVEKIINKKNKKRKMGGEADQSSTHIPVALFLNGIKVEEDIMCKDIFLESNKVVLKLFDVDYRVIINSPFVDGIALPNSMLANFPMYPSKFDCVHTNKKVSEFLWYKSLEKSNPTWIPIGEGYIFTPTNEEIGHYIKLSCTPKNGELEGPTIEVASENTVSASPGLCPFENRHQFTKEKCGSKEFRIVSYNILADLYADSEFSRNELYPYCPPYALEMDYRKQLIFKELLGYQADIICLQEVDKKVFEYDLNPVFGNLNFEANFTSKGTVGEGVACFYNIEKFRLYDKTCVILSEEIQTNPVFEEMWRCVSKNEKLTERFLEKKTVLQLTILKCLENNNILIIANSHLYFHPDADHIRLLQGGMCVKYLEDTYNKLNNQFPGLNLAIISCGDFNSVPKCGIYKLYTTGSVSANCIDWKSNKEEAVDGLSLTQPFAFKSACGTPEYTNYTVGFADCLDYIFYDTNKLKVSQVIPLPSNEELIQHTALPSVVFPSDHISLVADLKWL